MAKTIKPYEIPITGDLAADILQIPLETNDSMLTPPKTVGERLQWAMDAVAQANEMLARSTMAKIIARSIMRDLKKRGEPSLFVRHDGTVLLRVLYEDGTDEEAHSKNRRATFVTRATTIPYLDDLRKEAKDLGVDISDLGRARRAIYKRLQRARPPTP